MTRASRQKKIQRTARRTTKSKALTPTPGARSALPTAPTLSAPQLAAGVIVGDRYRLIEQYRSGTSAALSRGFDTSALWRGFDMALRRDVALSLVSVERFRADETGPDGLLSYARRTTGTSFAGAPHVARVYDVIATAGWVVTVAEWVPGWAFTELVRISPDVTGSVRAVRELAATVARAHHTSAFVPLGDPARVRVSHEERIVLAFPSTRSSTTKCGDVAGLGALLYALLLGTWPLASRYGTNGGLPDAARDHQGRLLTPRRLRPELSEELSDATMAALGVDGTPFSAAEFVQQLDRALVSAPIEVLHDAPVTDAHVDDGQVDAPVDDGQVDDDGELGEPEAGTASEDTDRAVITSKSTLERLVDRPARAIALACALVLGLAVVGWAVGTRMVSSDISAGAAEAFEELALPPVQEVAVLASGAQVYVPVGSPDNASDAVNVVDGDAATVWSTDRYAEQLPGYKPGVGVIVSFSNPGNIRNVWIDSPTPGTSVEVRTTPISGGGLETTQILGSGVTNEGLTHIPLVDEPIGRHELLIWVNGLSPVEGGFQSGFAEIGFTGKP